MALSQGAIDERLALAKSLLGAGEVDEAGQVLFALTDEAPRLGEAHRLLGVVCRLLGDPGAAEACMRRAIAVDAKGAGNHAELASLLAAEGRPKEAERAYRATLALNRRHEQAAIGLGRLLTEQGRGEEAPQPTAPLVALPTAGEALLAAHATALHAAGRDDDAIAAMRRAVAVSENPVAELRLAELLQDLAHHEEAEAACRAAIGKGRDTAEAWLLLAHALQDQRRFDEAEAAYGQVLERRPDHLQAHNDLAELIWMRSADLNRALGALDAAMEREAEQWGYGLAKARVQTYAGEPAAALATLTAARKAAPDEPILLAAAARAAWLAGEPDQGLTLAEQALAASPDDAALKLILAQACLTTGDAARGERLASAVVAGAPFDQLALSIQAVARRMLGDARYGALYDYDRLVHGADIEPPKGWTTKEAYLADLSAALGRLHGYTTHPFGQSVRGGSQVVLRGSREPVIAALPAALAAPIATILKAIGKGDGPVRGRNSGRWRFTGLWSVRLTSAGFHDNHVHPGGWLSSALHIDLPPLSPDGGDKAGYLSFGEPGLPTRPALPAERWVRPQPGRLVLFPSYMWHGTVPFAATTPRLAVAFDLVPA